MRDNLRRDPIGDIVDKPTLGDETVRRGGGRQIIAPNGGFPTASFRGSDLSISVELTIYPPKRVTSPYLTVSTRIRPSEHHTISWDRGHGSPKPSVITMRKAREAIISYLGSSSHGGFIDAVKGEGGGSTIYVSGLYRALPPTRRVKMVSDVGCPPITVSEKHYFVRRLGKVVIATSIGLTIHEGERNT